MESLRSKAIKLGATDLKQSERKNKKYAVMYNNKWIHFGHPDYEDYTIHKDPERRKRYRARASKIKNKDGQLTYKLKTSSEEGGTPFFLEIK